jgi:ABC-type glycerol-3-phosphate transport system permease component
VTPLQVSLAVTTVTALLTAVVGGFVAYQAYRGYRRNASRAMLFLAIGILLLTTIPFLLKQPLVLLSYMTTVEAELTAQTCRVAGLLTVLYAFTGA